MGWHRDERNIGKSFTVCLGDFTEGGELEVDLEYKIEKVRRRM